jgi:hypothetical protein
MPFNPLTQYKQYLNIILEPVYRYGLKQDLKQELSKLYSNKHAESHAECISRICCGVARWVETEGPNFEHSKKIRLLIDNLTNPNSKDFANYQEKHHNLVSGAFLVLGLLRAPFSLWEPLSGNTKNNILNNLIYTYKFDPHNNNWMLFKAIIELFLYKHKRVNHLDFTFKTLHQFENWYIGNGYYTDGPEHTNDYYNSIVIHPFILQITKTLEELNINNPPIKYNIALERAKLHFRDIEKVIDKDGNYPLIGRSLSYGSGVFHLLADMLATNDIPDNVNQEILLEKLLNVLKTTHPKIIFDKQGWIKRDKNIMGIKEIESYIDIGSLYARCLIFSVLGMKIK